MKRPAALLLLLATGGCMEPPKTGQQGQLVADLVHLHTWDPQRQAEGTYPYGEIMGYGPEILPVLAMNIPNETPTAIYHDKTDRNPKLGDVAFLMLLRLTSLKWENFASEGVFISTAIPNPIFCIMWKDEQVSRQKVRARFLKILDPDAGK